MDLDFCQGIVHRHLPAVRSPNTYLFQLRVFLGFGFQSIGGGYLYLTVLEDK